MAEAAWGTRMIGSKLRGARFMLTAPSLLFDVFSGCFCDDDRSDDPCCSACSSNVSIPAALYASAPDTL
jgi:hypothetical protein